MGVFSDWAEKYYDSGLYTIPCKGDKKPFLLEWTKYCETAPTEAVLSGWVKQYKESDQIGLLLGKSTKRVAFDFDYAYDPKKCKISEEDFKKDRERIEKEIMELLPDSPVGKVGMKGWTRFYKYNDALINKNCERNGVRLFDFLSHGRQTIIPPSIHSIVNEKKIVYRWTDGPLEDCSDLPELSMQIIETIISLYSDRPKERRPALDQLTRHERIMYFFKDTLRVDSDLERVASAAIEYDKKVNGPKTYLDDKTHNKTTDAKVNSLNFATRMQKWMVRNDLLSSKEEKKENNIVTTIGWDHFFQISFGECRKDIFSMDTFVRKSEDQPWEPIKKHEEILKSYARQKKMPKTHVPEELARWTYENGSLEFLCDLPKWDGVDRITLFGKSNHSEKFSHDEITEIFKHWGVGIFRRLDNPEIQNRALILTGLQGIGKDSMVREAFGSFKPYYQMTGLTGTPKDVLEIVSRLLIVHIEEFDQTKGIDVAFLKALITQPSSYFRESYGHSPSSKIMRPSFISTANVSDIFRDPTGNRRFIVIPIDKLTWDYPQKQSPQIMAQLKQLFEDGKHFTLDSSIEGKIKAIIDDLTPEGLDVPIVDLFKDRFKSLTGVNGRFPGARTLSGPQVVELLGKIAKDLQCSMKRVQMTLKSGGYAKRYNGGIRYFIDPSNAPCAPSTVPSTVPSTDQTRHEF